jgi:alpha-glucosidase
MKLSTALLGLAVASRAAAAPYIPAQSWLRPRQDASDGIIDIPSPVDHTAKPDQCAGYKLDELEAHDTGFDGTLSLIGKCNAYGPDYQSLKIQVRHETPDRLRVRITDAEGKAHIVPDDVAEWPKIDDNTVTADESNLQIDIVQEPFGFKVLRKADGEVLFNTEGHPLIFEEQYVRVRSALAEGSYIQGLAQHSDNFTLPIQEEGYTRTLWTRDAYSVPGRTNLYGAHPFYVNQKVGEKASASGTFLLSSQGMDIKFPNGGSEIEFNALGGIVDLFFLNGPTPADVARQGSQIWGVSEAVPYWSLGFHSCRYGYIDIAYVAEVVANYTAAGIPLEVQWMDIDYMKDVSMG